MALRKLTCPVCGHRWKYGYWEWVFKAQFHVFNFLKWKDKRRTRCPYCKEISWIYSEK